MKNLNVILFIKKFQVVSYIIDFAKERGLTSLLNTNQNYFHGITSDINIQLKEICQ